MVFEVDWCPRETVMQDLCVIALQGIVATIALISKSTLSIARFLGDTREQHLSNKENPFIAPMKKGHYFYLIDGAGYKIWIFLFTRDCFGIRNLERILAQL